MAGELLEQGSYFCLFREVQAQIFIGMLEGMAGKVSEKKFDL